MTPGWIRRGSLEAQQRGRLVASKVPEVTEHHTSVESPKLFHVLLGEIGSTEGSEPRPGHQRPIDAKASLVAVRPARDANPRIALREPGRPARGHRHLERVRVCAHVSSRFGCALSSRTLQAHAQCSVRRTSEHVRLLRISAHHCQTCMTHQACEIVRSNASFRGGYAHAHPTGMAAEPLCQRRCRCRWHAVMLKIACHGALDDIADAPGAETTCADPAASFQAPQKRFAWFDACPRNPARDGFHDQGVRRGGYDHTFGSRLRGLTAEQDDFSPLFADIERTPTCSYAVPVKCRSLGSAQAKNIERRQ
jgi:hypothetical protein